jgi:hypothetical protein
VSDILNLLGGQVSQLFSSSGYAGIVVSTEAILDLQEAGDYDPRNKDAGPGLYYNLATKEFDSPTAPTIRVIPIQNKAYAGAGANATNAALQVFYMQPLSGFKAMDMVQLGMQVFGNDYTITNCRVVALGPAEVIWEVQCQ